MSDLLNLLTQLRDGRDFAAPSGLLRGISPEIAEAAPEGAPYSVADNLAHALRWQEHWLALARGERRNNIAVNKEDWLPAEPGEYDELRKAFVAGIAEARELADGDLPPERRDLLVRIALHGA